jgi:hypothetical protein
MSIRVSHHVTPEGLVCLTAHLPCGRVVRVVGEPGDETGRAFEGILLHEGTREVLALLTEAGL